MEALESEEDWALNQALMC